LPVGMYLFRARSASGQTVVRKWTVLR
jgi:hypothetical protein